MYDGYLEFGGIEIGNAERVTRYVEHQAPEIPLVRRYERDIEGLHIALGDKPYESPLVDDAPWLDDNNPASRRFLGIYPLKIEGIGDSTRAAETVEATRAGGTTQEARDATREVRYTALLVAQDELALESGLSWLRQVVRGDVCGLHSGGSCGASDLRFFLDKPDVCDPLWSETWEWDGNSEVDTQQGRVTPDVSPLIYVPKHDQTMSLRGRWMYPADTGDAVVEYGVVERDTIAAAGPVHHVALRRTNLMPNPSFRQDLQHWVSLAGGATRFVDPDGRAHASVTGSSSQTTRVNFFPDPAFTLDDAEASGWRTNGVATKGDGSTTFTAVGGQTDPLYAETTLGGPDAIGDGQVVNVSIDVDLALDLRVIFLDQFGDVQLSDTPDVSEGVTRVAYDVPATTGWTVRLVTNSSSMSVARPLAEVLAPGDGPGEFFYGGQASTDTAMYSYLTDDPTSPSREVVGTASEFEFVSPTAGGAWGPVLAQMIVRSASGGQVTIALEDEANYVLSSRVIDLTDQWQAVPLTAENTNNTHLRFTGTGSVDIDDVIVEDTRIVMDYFDGDTPTQPLYDLIADRAHDGVDQPAIEYDWVAYKGLLHSTATFVGSLYFTADDSTGSPYISVLEGQIDNISLELASFTGTPVADQLVPYERFYHRVSVIGGPTQIAKDQTYPGVLLQVEVYFNANDPFAYGATKEVLYMEPLTNGYRHVFEPEAVVTNAFTNPKMVGTGSLPGISPWTASAGATLSNGSSTTPLALPGVKKPGTKYRRITATAIATANNFGFALASFTLPAGNQGLNFLGYFRANRTRGLLMWARFYNAAGTAIGDKSGSVKTNENPTLRANAWTEAYLQIDARDFPAGAARAVIYTAGNGTIAWKPGDNLDVTHIFLSQSGRQDAYGLMYFDGDTPDSDDFFHQWTGTANASTSTRTLQQVYSEKALDNPLLPATPAPPKAPPIFAVQPLDFDRMWGNIPASDVTQSAETVPSLEIVTRPPGKNPATQQTYANLYNTRIRFYPNPFGFPPEKIDPDSYCGEMVITYLPRDTRFTLNGLTEDAYGQVGAGPELPADHLLFAYDGGPVVWPTLSCGIDYAVSVDVALAEPITGNGNGPIVSLASVTVTANLRE